MDKLQIYIAMGNIKTYCEYLDNEYGKKELADKIREELEEIRKYILEK